MRDLLEATYRFVNAAGLQEFGTDARLAEEGEAVERAKEALHRLGIMQPVR